MVCAPELIANSLRGLFGCRIAPSDGLRFRTHLLVNSLRVLFGCQIAPSSGLALPSKPRELGNSLRGSFHRADPLRRFGGSRDGVLLESRERLRPGVELDFAEGSRRLPMHLSSSVSSALLSSLGRCACNAAMKGSNILAMTQMSSHASALRVP